LNYGIYVVTHNIRFSLVLHGVSAVPLSEVPVAGMEPMTRVSRYWANLEAALGQFYLAIVVARLVGLQITSSPEGRASGRGRKAR
jgi:hypothetical protein